MLAGADWLVNVDPWLKLAEIIPEAILTRLRGNLWGWLCWGGLVMNVDPWLKLAEIIPAAILTRMGGNWLGGAGFADRGGLVMNVDPWLKLAEIIP